MTTYFESQIGQLHDEIESFEKMEERYQRIFGSDDDWVGAALEYWDQNVGFSKQIPSPKEIKEYYDEHKDKIEVD